MLYPITIVLTKLMIAATILSHERVPEWEVRCNPSYDQCWVQNMSQQRNEVFEVRYVMRVHGYAACAVAEGHDQCTRGSKVEICPGFDAEGVLVCYTPDPPMLGTGPR